MKLRIACRQLWLMEGEIPAFGSRHRMKDHTLNMRTRRWEFLSGNEGNSLAADCITRRRGREDLNWSADILVRIECGARRRVENLRRRIIESVAATRAESRVAADFTRARGAIDAERHRRRILAECRGQRSEVRGQSSARSSDL